MSTYLNLKPIEYSKLSAKRKAVVKWEGRILLPKYDGCLALVYVKLGKLVKIVSRDNKPVRSMDHIIDDLNARYDWLQDVEHAVILGEAWNPGKTFAEISGTFRRHSPQPSLGFAPFDIVNYDEAGGWLYDDEVYSKRLSYLTNAKQAYCNVFPPLPITCEDEDHAHRYASKCKALGGYDGAIASDPLAPYVVSDGMGEFLKLKPLRSFSLVVTDVQAGTGSKTGRATAALGVRFKQGTCYVGTGFSNADAAAWTADPSTVIGRTAEVSCMDVYPGEDGMMREPRLVGWRDDVTNPDY